MSSNESVERMLKQLENLLRQQDKNQSKETEAGPEPVAAEAASPGPAEEQKAGDLPPTPDVEAIDNVESPAPVDEAGEPASMATGDSVPVGMSGAQGLQVETVPSEEDWYEIDGPGQAAAGGNDEQAPVEASPPDAVVIEDTSGEGLSTEPSTPDKVAIEEGEADDSEELPHRRRRFSIGDMLNLSNHQKEEVVEDESPVQEADVPAGEDDQPADPPDEPHEISAEGPIEVPNVVDEPQETAHAFAASGSPDERGEEELSTSTVGFNMEAEAGPVHPDEDAADDVHGSAGPGTVTEPGEDDESPTSKYPSWWFRGGSVHTYEDGEEAGASNGGGDTGTADDPDSDGRGVEEPAATAARTDRPNVEPFVRRKPVVGPPPVRKLISEQLQEEELAEERQAAAEGETEDVGETPGEVIIGIEGLNAVSEPSDAVPVEEPEVVEVIEEDAEDDVDPARALKIVESLAEAMAHREAEAPEEVAHLEEATVPDEDSHIEEDAVPGEVGHLDEVAALEDGSADAEGASIEEVVAQDEDTVMEDEELDEDVSDFFAGGPQIPVIIDHEGATPAEVEPGPISALVDGPEANVPEAELPQVEAPQVEVTQSEVAGIETTQVEVAGIEATQVEVPEIEATQVETPEIEATQVETPPLEEPLVEALPIEDSQEETPAPPVDSAPLDDSMPERPRRRLTARLGTLLLDAHLISERDLDRALEEHQACGERLGHYLVDKGMVDEEDLARVLSDQYGVPAADLENLDVSLAVVRLVPERTARRYTALPVAVGDGVVDVAMVDPADVGAIKALEYATGLRVQPLIATEWAIERAIRRVHGGGDFRGALAGDAGDLSDPRAIIKRMIRDRDEAIMQSERDSRQAYKLAASIDDFVDEILRVAEKLQE